jgi:SAM-dependent methyltransferase
VNESPARFYNTVDPQRWGRPEMPEALEVTRGWTARAGIGSGERAVELGCGQGALAGVSERYVGIDLSLAALTASKARRRICGDIERLPLAGDSAGFIFSWAALEHVPNPERVLAEVARVLRPGGVAVLAPAWHCRPWAAEGLEFRPYRELTLAQCIRKALIPLRNALWWRALFEMPRRLVREVRAGSGRPIAFHYRRLSPNLETYLGTDSDAFTSMDPHAAIMWFATRGWAILSHPTFRIRIAARSEPVVVRKPLVA